MAIWRPHIKCCILKAKNTKSEYVIHIAFPQQQWLHDAPQCYVIRILPVLLLVTNNRNKAAINNTPRHSLFSVLTICFSHKNIHIAHIQYNR
jgi:hypothetical protein